MRYFLKFNAVMIAVLALAGPSLGGSVTSAYTMINFEDGTCIRFDEPPEDEQSAFGIFRCKGYQGHAVWLSAGDLRESVQFGNFTPERAVERFWESFSSFNSINTTIEWRLEDGKPFAAIYRHFTFNPNNSSEGDSPEGQYLMIKSVAREETGGVGCLYGVIDAIKTSKANELARKVADNMLNPVAKCVDDSRIAIYGHDDAAPYFKPVGEETSMSRSFPGGD